MMLSCSSTLFLSLVSLYPPVIVCAFISVNEIDDRTTKEINYKFNLDIEFNLLFPNPRSHAMAIYDLIRTNCFTIRQKPIIEKILSNISSIYLFTSRILCRVISHSEWNSASEECVGKGLCIETHLTANEFGMLCRQFGQFVIVCAGRTHHPFFQFRMSGQLAKGNGNELKCNIFVNWRGDVLVRVSE